MRRHERERMTIMAAVQRQELTQVQAAQLLGVGYRQTKRVWRRYQAEGDAGVVHRLRGHLESLGHSRSVPVRRSAAPSANS